MDPADKKKRATYQEVLDAPEYNVAEIIAGQLSLSPRPGAPHARVTTALGNVLSHFDGGGGPGGWTFLDEPELHFADEILVPDIGAWREERMPVVPDASFITLSPDWICEVISDSTEKRDRIDKMPLYASFGVRYAWLVHPRHRTVEAFQLREGRWTNIGNYVDGDRARIEPFEALELDLMRLW